MKDVPLFPGDRELEYDQARGVYRIRHDSVDEPTSTVVVAILSAITGTDPLDLEPLRGAVDPDALDDIFASTSGGNGREIGYVEFSLAGHHVVVYASGKVEVRPPQNGN